MTSGCACVRNDAGEVGFEVTVGGGLGRTPMLGPRDPRVRCRRRTCCPTSRRSCGVYNQLGRRDNKYKARIKIAVHEMGLETLTALVEERFVANRAVSSPASTRHVLGRIDGAVRAAGVRCRPSPIADAVQTAGFRAWRRHERCGAPASGSRHGHDLAQAASAARPATRRPSRCARWPTSPTPIAYGEMRVSHAAERDPAACAAGGPARGLRGAACRRGSRRANLGLISDIIACPGMDYCALANARSIPIAQQIAQRFAELKRAARGRRR